MKKYERGFIMSQLNQMEFNAIREIASGHQMMAKKLGAYANQCQDQEIKQMFQTASNEAMSSSKRLIDML